MGVRNEILCFTVSSTELYVHSRWAIQKPLFWIGLAQRQSKKGGKANFRVDSGRFLVHVDKTNSKLYPNSETLSVKSDETGKLVQNNLKVMK